MPLSDLLPLIDDRRYSDILDELRTRIPRYTPEWKGWTDLNDSDPGMTLSQLMAWLAEMMIYRMNKVPQLNYVKFLELLGVELNPAQPSVAEIEFPVKGDHPEPFVLVPLRTQVSAEDREGGAPITFETDRAIYALTIRLTSVQAFESATYRNVTADNNNLNSYLPFGSSARGGAALYLGFNYPKEYRGAEIFPRIALDLAVTVAGNLSEGPTVVGCVGSSTRTVRPATIIWETTDGNDWRTLSVIKDETLALTRSGHIILQTPPADFMKKVRVGDAGGEEEGFFIRARVERSGYVRPPSLISIRTNTAQATQAETVKDEVLGGSNGRREQIFTLGNRPVLVDSLRLEIDEGDGARPWTRVDDFLDSKAEDTHYVLNANTGEIRLGGVRFEETLHGHVPVANVQSPGANVVAREYRFGGGKRGNVEALTLTTLVTPIGGIDDRAVTNRFAAYSGRDEETVEEAIVRAKRSIRSRSRAVTRDDFEQIAQEAGNVKRARAVPLFHPDFPGTEIPGVVSVIVVPDSDSKRPTPSEGMLREVCAYLNDRRLLTTEVFVMGPTYQQVEVRGQVIVDDNADLGEVKKEVEETLTTYFHPLKGGDEGGGWPFGGTIFYSKVMNRIFGIRGVARIEQLELYLNGQKKEKCTDVEIKPLGLIYSIEHQVEVGYAVLEAP